MKISRGNATRSLVVCGLAAAGLLLPAHQAQAGGNAGGSVEPFYGSYQTEVPIEVPAYHGLEPRLSLQYSSSAGSGFAGMGWGLSGFSTIERMSPGRGAPRFDASDIYVLDGQALVPCTSLGGTHCTKVQSYLRIQKDVPAAGKWTVTSKDGTKQVYASVLGTTSGTVRYGVSAVTDTKGHTVSYGWWCDGTSDCYPASVSYNGSTVTFYREARSDVTSFAIGAGLGVTSYRLKSIDVKTGASRVRAYRLSYATAAGTGASLLVSSQMVGRDATVDASGTVSGGTAAPAVSLSYLSDSAGWQTSTAFAPPFHIVDNGTDLGARFIDVNGDGKTDMVYHRYLSSGAQKGAYLSTGSGWQWAPQYAPPFHIVDGGAGGADLGARFIDVNGDGKTDMVYHRHLSSGAQKGAYLATSTGWQWAPQFTPPFHIVDGGAGGRDLGARFVDVNGDGKTDMVYHRYLSSGAQKGAYLATDSGWQWAPAFTPPFHIVDGGAGGADLGARFVDVNGDGKTDMVYHRYLSSGAQKGAYLSTGTGWQWAPALAPPFHIVDGGAGGRDLGARFVDVNGDGKTDMVYHRYLSSGAQKGAYLSTGNGWQWAAGFTPPFHIVDGGAGGADLGARFVDVNGDGRVDMVYHRYLSSGPQKGAYLSSGSGWRWAPQFTPAFHIVDGGAGGRDLGARFADVDGDGAADMVYHRYVSTGSQKGAYLSGGEKAGLMSALANGQGGTTTIAYTPSSAWANTNNPPVQQTVMSVAVSNGRGGTSTTKYSYAGGLWDAVERRFMGFRYVKETQPCIVGESACPYTETWFKQDYGSVSKPERIDQRAGNGALVSSTLSTYTTNGATVPHTSLETGLWQYVYDGSGASCATWPCAYGRRTYASRSFDSYGNVTRETVYGDYDVGGDEKTQTTTFVPNTSAFLVGLPAAMRTYSGTAASGTPLSEGLVYFDGATTWNAAPTAGKETKSCSLLSGANYVCTSRGYDAWGNVVSETNALGRTKTVTMDGTYHQFPLVVTNAKGQTASTTWDTVCGAPLTVTNANGGVTSFSYDALCRETQVTQPGGGFKLTSYVNIGNPATQYVQIQKPGPSGQGNDWMREYIDGLGQAWRREKRGPAAGQEIREDLTYDARGNAYQTSGPYYANTTPTWTTASHDALNRLTRLTNPDGTYETRTYGLGSMTVTDELGRQRKEEADAYGRAIARRELHNGSWVTTTYSYDALGNLASAKDPAGNTATYSYDGLGRKVSQNDPDGGFWQYQYDAAGQTTAIIDAKGQRTEFGYDVLGRRTQKVTKLASGAVERTVTWTYDEVRAGYKNIGKLTSMTDPAGTATYNHDAAGRLVEGGRTLGGVSYRFAKGYDTGGRLLWTTYPDGDTVGTPAAPITYDASGRIISIPGYVTAATYTAWGQIASQTNANGTVLTRTYNNSRRWVTGISTIKGATTIQNLGITRDAAGKITTITSPFANEGWSYGYDDMDRLTSATNTSNSAYSQSFAYANNGNMTYNSRVGNYAYNAAGTARPHATITAGGNTYTYDANGSMVSGAGRTIAWNVDNQPVAINGTTFVYDGEGARLQKTVGGQVTKTLGDDYEIAPSGTVTKYISLDGRVVAKKVGTTKYWVHTDHQGSIQAVTDAAGAELQRLKYRAYGDRLSTSTGHAESRGYTGQRQDETGLFYLHARYYDPVLGRFISADPTVPTNRSVGLNRYAYGANDPANHTDVDGLGFFKKLFKAIKKIFKAIVSIVKAILPVVLGMIPGIGQVLQIAYMAYVASKAKNPFKTFLVMMVAKYVGAGIDVPGAGAGLLDKAMYVGKQALVGGATGYAVARVNGVPHALALKAAQGGALMSGAFAAAAVFYKAFAGERPDEAANGPKHGQAPGSQVANQIPEGTWGRWWHDNVTGEHSPVMKWTAKIGIGNAQAGLHDPLQEYLFPGDYVPGTRQFLNTGFWADLPKDFAAFATNVAAGQVTEYAYYASTGMGAVEIGDRIITEQRKAEAQMRAYYARLASASGQVVAP